MNGRGPHWEFHAVPDPVAGLEAAYQGIYFGLLGWGNSRLNQRLEVRGGDLETRNGWHRVLLVTPWTGLHAYLPEKPHNPPGLPAPEAFETEEEGRVTAGGKVTLAFGGHQRELQVAHDSRLGHHLTEVLLHDVGAFADTEEAMVWARGVAASREGEKETPPSPRPEPRRVSRRDLLRGRLGGGN